MPKDIHMGRGRRAALGSGGWGRGPVPALMGMLVVAIGAVDPTARLCEVVSAREPHPEDNAVSASQSLVDGTLEPPPILFEGLGLEGFGGRSSIARALRECEAERDERPPVDLGMTVVGPGSRVGVKPLKLQADTPVPGPLQAVVKSRVSGVDVSAGVDASAETIQSGPARWMGGIGIRGEGPAGRAELALRTSVRYADAHRLIRVEVGPRFERPIGKGVMFFLDGKAEAETAPSLVEPVATLPGMSAEGLGFVGLTGRTGLVR